jgi:sugar transferase (PEP-CTERM system associated)
MLRIFRHYIPKTLVLLGVAEALILLVSIYLGAILGFAVEDMSLADRFAVGLPLWAKAALFSGVMLVGMTAMGFYQRDQRDGPALTLLRLGLSFAFGFVMMGAAYFVYPPLTVGWPAFGVALLCSFIGIATCRLICSAHTDAQFCRRVLVLGVGERAKQIENLRRSSDRLGISIVGYVDIGVDQQLVTEAKVIRPKATLRELAERFAVDEIVVAIDDRRRGFPVHDILDCKMHGINILEESVFYERQLGKIRLDALHPSNVIFSDGYTPAVLKQTEKRLIDVTAAALLLLVTVPVFLVTALAIKLESRGPIFYRQARVGRRGDVFQVYKFRSMRPDAERNGAVWARSNDDRVTRVGRFIRKVRIDELPQLINVLNGDMSFVGPRPERPEFVQELARAIPYYDLRHYVKPGITGWAQVCYPYGASIKDAREKLQFDLYYIKNYSVFLDITILLQTVQVILWGKGAR